MGRIEQIASEIRKYINRPRKQNLLLKNNKFWNQLCSSLDVVEDTDLALQSYLENDFPKKSGEKYLRVYGTLQVLIVQQDAVKNLIEALSLPYTPSSSLKEIRDIRIKSIGHPTKTGWKKGEETYHFISRITMSKNGFDLISSHPDENDEFIKINVPELIAKQRKIISKMLTDIHDNLQKEEKQHKEQFKTEKLIDVFPQTLGYYFSKIYETLYSKTYPKSFGKTHIKYVEETLEKFKQALEKRKLWEAYDSINHLYDDLNFPIQELKKYFETEDQSEPADRQARINLFFIEKQIDELKEIAKEIDGDYRQSN